MAIQTQRQRNGLYELTDAARAELVDSKYYNNDLAPTSLSERTWNTYNISMLWVGMSICIPSITMASSMVALGISPWLSVLNVIIGNILILIPIQLNSHAGTKYGIPFPVFARMTFGVIGAHIPSLSRAITACGWNAVQSSLGGAAVVWAIALFVPSVGESAAWNYIGFFIFLFVTWLITVFGQKTIRIFESIGSPVLVVLCIALLVWSLIITGQSGHSFGDIFATTSNTELTAEKGGFLLVFLAGLTGNIAFWATMALNIPDFSRYAKSQKSQFRGQLYGMPIAMAFCAFVGAVFAQSTLFKYGEMIWDPTAILNTSYLGDSSPAKVAIFIVCIGVIVATLTTNVAANVVAPANGISNISPKRISYATGTTIACLVAILYKVFLNLNDTASNYIFGWLNTYGGILAPIAAIFIADYYFVKKRNIDVISLFNGKKGRYWYQNGWNVRAVIAWICGFILPTIGGFTPNITALKWISANGYIFGFIVGFVVYVILMQSEKTSFISDKDESDITER